MSDRITTPQPEEIKELADLLKVFADETRIRILFSLAEQEHNVSELTEELEMTQSAVSHQLQTLKASKLVKSRRDGKSMYYSLADEHVNAILATGLEHVLEED